MQSLLEDEFGLRHWTFSGTNHQTNTVDHGHNSLHFASEILMARRVNNVKFVVSVDHTGALRQNGDSSLLLQIVAVHGAFRRERYSCLVEQAIDQSRLAVIYMSNNGQIAHLGRVFTFQDFQRLFQIELSIFFSLSRVLLVIHHRRKTPYVL